MSNPSLPLYFAIIKYFENGTVDCAQRVATALEPEYFGYKLLTLNDEAEALATAKENGILEETAYAIDSNMQLVTSYKLTEFGKDMVISNKHSNKLRQ